MNSTNLDGPTKERLIILDLFKKYKSELINIKYAGLQDNLEIDIKKVAGTPSLFNFITTLAAKRLNNYNQIIGLNLRGDSYSDVYAYAIGMKAEIPTAVLRLETTKVGSSIGLEGCINKKLEKIVVISDEIPKESYLLTETGPKYLKECGYEIKDIFVVIENDRSGGHIRSKLKDRGMNLISLFTEEEILEFCGKK